MGKPMGTPWELHKLWFTDIGLDARSDRVSKAAGSSTDSDLEPEMILVNGRKLSWASWLFHYGIITEAETENPPV